METDCPVSIEVSTKCDGTSPEELAAKEAADTIWFGTGDDDDENDSVTINWDDTGPADLLEHLSQLDKYLNRPIIGHRIESVPLVLTRAEVEAWPWTQPPELTYIREIREGDEILEGDVIYLKEKE